MLVAHGKVSKKLGEKQYDLPCGPEHNSPSVHSSLHVQVRDPKQRHVSPAWQSLNVSTSRQLRYARQSASLVQGSPAKPVIEVAGDGVVVSGGVNDGEGSVEDAGERVTAGDEAGLEVMGAVVDGTLDGVEESGEDGAGVDVDAVEGDAEAGGGEVGEGRGEDESGGGGEAGAGDGELGARAGGENDGEVGAEGGDGEAEELGWSRLGKSPLPVPLLVP